MFIFVFCFWFELQDLSEIEGYFFVGYCLFDLMKSKNWKIYEVYFFVYIICYSCKLKKWVLINFQDQYVVWLKIDYLG